MVEMVVVMEVEVIVVGHGIGWSSRRLVIMSVGHCGGGYGGDDGDRGGGGDGSGRCRLEGSGAWKPIENGNERKT